MGFEPTTFSSQDGHPAAVSTTTTSREIRLLTIGFPLKWLCAAYGQKMVNFQIPEQWRNKL